MNRKRYTAHYRVRHGDSTKLLGEFVALSSNGAIQQSLRRLSFLNQEAVAIMVAEADPTEQCHR